MRISKNSFLVATSVLGAAGFIGCLHLPDEFDEFGAQASVWRMRPIEPGNEFGAVLVGYEAPTSQSPTRATRLFAGGTGASTFATFAISDESREVGVGNPATATLTARLHADRTSSPVFTGCTNGDREGTLSRCGPGRRAAAAVPVIHTTTNDLLGCVLVTTGTTTRAGLPEQEGLQIQCESGTENRSVNFILAPGLGWGASAAGLPLVHDMGIALLGAPLAHEGSGGVFLLRHIRDARTGLGPTDPYAGQVGSEGRLRDELVISGLTLNPNEHLGSVLAVTRTGTLPFRFASSFGPPGNRRVVVAEVSWDETRRVASARVVGCLSRAVNNFGSALAFGRFDNGPIEDLAVSAVQSSGESVVSIFDGAEFTATSCSTTEAGRSLPVTIGCDADGVTCSDSRFGEAIAAGDINADGRDDLVVGVPGADVGLRSNLGALQVFTGASELSSFGEERGLIVLSNSAIESQLGVAVTTIPSAVRFEGTQRIVRAEIAASQALSQGTFVFLCSDIAADTQSTITQRQEDARVEFSCGLIQNHAVEGMSTSNLDPALRP